MWNGPQIQDLLQIDQKSEPSLYSHIYDLNTLSLPLFDPYFELNKRQKYAAKDYLSRHTPEFAKKLLAVIELAELLKQANEPLDYLKVSQEVFRNTGDAFLEYSLVLNAIWHNQTSLDILYKERESLSTRGLDFEAMEKRFVPNWPKFSEKIESPDKIVNLPNSTQEDEKKQESKKYGLFPKANRSLSKFKEVAKDRSLTDSWYAEFHTHTKQDPEMVRLRKERDQRHEAGFSYDIIQCRNSPKMIVHGSPRKDRHECVKEFYKMLLNENVRVVVGLNTFSDWKKAIPYYDEDVLADANIGWKITCSGVKVLYEGAVATNIPKDLQEKRNAIPLDDSAFKPYRVRIEERIIIAERKGETRAITHLHYINWADGNEAPDLEALKVLMKRQENLLEGTNAPVAIHCQGGIARTLSYVLSIWMRQEIREAKRLESPLEMKQFNLPEMTYELKKQAPRLNCGPSKGDLFSRVYELTAGYLEEQTKYN
jgi:protein tyrosine phosphatase